MIKVFLLPSPSIGKRSGLTPDYKQISYQIKMRSKKIGNVNFF